MDSVVGNLLNEIVKLDTDPQVFNVNLIANSFTCGFAALVSFRGDHHARSHVQDFLVRGATPEECLGGMLEQLKTHFSPCPHCGRRGPINES